MTQWHSQGTTPANRLLRNLAAKNGLYWRRASPEAHLSISYDGFHFRFRQLAGVDPCVSTVCNQRKLGRCDEATGELRFVSAAY